ncbi:MAG: hypothetical protein CVU39_15745 [Chloroflexi bacterium HGW-Chloroflexi-10]|nr:MAG: hypothetical protein CVU39_15745 [Chloroflexi bacterium HGW-Chloroflexi-10]
MYVTILSGRVADENWRGLESSFEQVIKHPPQGILSSTLIQCQGEPKLWQIITTWKSHAAYKEAQEQKITSICYDLFCNAGTTPHHNEFKVHAKYTRV